MIDYIVPPIPTSPQWRTEELAEPDAIGIAIENLHRLRDEFAGRALSAMRLYNLTDVELLEASEGAYWLADAMLAAKFNTMIWGKK